MVLRHWEEKCCRRVCRWGTVQLRQWILRDSMSLLRRARRLCCVCPSVRGTLSCGEHENAQTLEHDSGLQHGKGMKPYWHPGWSLAAGPNSRQDIGVSETPPTPVSWRPLGHQVTLNSAIPILQCLCWSALNRSSCFWCHPARKGNVALEWS